MPGTKAFLILFGLQVFNYAIICFNTRAIAQANISWTVASDLVIAASTFATLHFITTLENRVAQFLGYLIGSAIGSAAGILLSQTVLGG